MALWPHGLLDQDLKQTRLTEERNRCEFVW